MAQAKIRYSGNSMDLDLNAGTLVRDITGNASFAAVLGFDSNNVEAYVGGVKLEPTRKVVEGDVITLQQKAHAKA